MGPRNSRRVGLRFFRFCLRLFQLSDVSQQFVFRGPPREVMTDHLERSLRWLVAGPQGDHQACDQGHVNLNGHAIFTCR